MISISVLRLGQGQATPLAGEFDPTEINHILLKSLANIGI
jgi:hypothetical protein